MYRREERTAETASVASGSGPRVSGEFQLELSDLSAPRRPRLFLILPPSSCSHGKLKFFTHAAKLVVDTILYILFISITNTSDHSLYTTKLARCLFLFRAPSLRAQVGSTFRGRTFKTLFDWILYVSIVSVGRASHSPSKMRAVAAGLSGACHALDDLRLCLVGAPSLHFQGHSKFTVRSGRLLANGIVQFLFRTVIKRGRRSLLMERALDALAL